PHWLAEIARALADHPAADVVSGVIVPAELETAAQVWFEQFGGHSKGRGFRPAAFSPATAKTQSPLYPLPPFGTGANMAFRRGVIGGGLRTATIREDFPRDLLAANRRGMLRGPGAYLAGRRRDKRRDDQHRNRKPPPR